MRLICSGSARGFICAISVRLKQVFHDVGDNSIFALLLGGLAIWNMNADPVFDPGTLKSHLEMDQSVSRTKRVRIKTTYVRKLANNTSATDFDGRRLVGGPGGVTAMTRTTNRATANSVVATWNADHLKGRKLAPALADEKRVALGLWSGGGINIYVQRRNPSSGLCNITGGRKVSRRLVNTRKVKIHVRVCRAGPLPPHLLSLLLSAVHSFLSLVFGFSGKKPRLPLLG